MSNKYLEKLAELEGLEKEAGATSTLIRSVLSRGKQLKLPLEGGSSSGKLMGGKVRVSGKMIDPSTHVGAGTRVASTVAGIPSKGMSSLNTGLSAAASDAASLLPKKAYPAADKFIRTQLDLTPHLVNAGKAAYHDSKALVTKGKGSQLSLPLGAGSKDYNPIPHRYRPNVADMAAYAGKASAGIELVRHLI